MFKFHYLSNNYYRNRPSKITNPSQWTRFGDHFGVIDDAVSAMAPAGKDSVFHGEGNEWYFL